MNIITRNLALLALPKIIRQLMAALAAFFVAHGVHAGTGTVGDLVVGLLVLGGTVLWSYFAKRAPSEEDKAWLGNMATAAASQLLPALSGWLAARGMVSGGITADSSVEGVLLALANYWLSATTRPDKAKG